MPHSDRRVHLIVTGVLLPLWCSKISSLGVSLVTVGSGKGYYPPSCTPELGRSKMSLYQTGPPRPRVLAKALVAPAPVLDTGFAIVRAESVLAVRTRRVADLLFVFALAILPMAAMITLLFL